MAVLPEDSLMGAVSQLTTFGGEDERIDSIETRSDRSTSTRWNAYPAATRRRVVVTM
jgi:hypothetical protein